jgi:hypothetical protein
MSTGVTQNHARTIVMIKGLATQEAARTVRDRLLMLDGVLAVRMSITDPSARVDYLPSKLSPSHIAATIGQMGYSTTVRSMLRTM